MICKLSVMLSYISVFRANYVLPVFYKVALSAYGTWSPQQPFEKGRAGVIAPSLHKECESWWLDGSLQTL